MSCSFPVGNHELIGGCFDTSHVVTGDECSEYLLLVPGVSLHSTAELCLKRLILSCSFLLPRQNLGQGYLVTVHTSEAFPSLSSAAPCGAIWTPRKLEPWEFAFHLSMWEAPGQAPNLRFNPSMGVRQVGNPHRVGVLVHEVTTFVC